MGGGIGGMSAAVQLKDTGYSPFVIEKQPVLGGQCNTVYFDPPSPGLDDVGVVLFYNTTMLNTFGLGQWIDLPAYFSRFVEELLPPPFSPTIPTYFSDFKTGSSSFPLPSIKWLSRRP